jgi:hypothetical protein
MMGRKEGKKYIKEGRKGGREERIKEGRRERIKEGRNQGRKD